MLKAETPPKNKDQLIAVVSAAGDRYGSLLLKFMDCYGLNCLASATAEQLSAFIEAEHINEGSYSKCLKTKTVSR